jgi:hypothetical protein
VSVGTFYVAGTISKPEGPLELISRLEAAGLTCTYNWAAHGKIYGQPEKYAAIAQAEIQGAAEADLLILLLPAGRGSHAELGASLSNGKKVLIVLPPDLSMHLVKGEGTDTTSGYFSLFYHHPAVRVLSGDIDVDNIVFSALRRFRG